MIAMSGKDVYGTREAEADATQSLMRSRKIRAAAGTYFIYSPRIHPYPFRLLHLKSILYPYDTTIGSLHLLLT